MEVLRPQLVRIEGRNYRKNPIQEKTYQHEEEDEDFYRGNWGGCLARAEVQRTLWCWNCSLFRLPEYLCQC